jgi:hypothetical protein
MPPTLNEAFPTSHVHAGQSHRATPNLVHESGFFCHDYRFFTTSAWCRHLSGNIQIVREWDIKCWGSELECMIA